MRVSDLAKEFHTTSETILAKLRSLKLKAKDSDQELNSAVTVVLRSELIKELKGRPQEIKGSKEKIKPQEKIKRPAPEKVLPTSKKPAKAALAKTKAVGKSVTAKKSSSTTKAPQKPALKKVPLPKVKPPEFVKPPAPKPFFSRESPLRAVPEAPKPVSPKKAPARPQTVTTEAIHPQPAAPPTAVSLLQPLEIKVPISVKDLSVRLQQKPSLLLKRLLEKGIFANINQNLSEEVTKDLALHFGYEMIKARTQEEQLLQLHKLEEDSAQLKPRPPVVTLMGHVDHGKTSLLDKIRKSRIADQEHGGITQHIGAYSVPHPKGKITFLDTPGHEAFTAMRARGAHLTDLVILVVAADEGVMPQTQEAVDHARAAQVPIVVALNKIDKPGADPDRVKKQLADCDLAPEDWGGKTVVVGVSASTGEGIDHLLEMILLEAELLELKANDQRKASGAVVEAHVSHGKGPVATVIVQNGTLKEGDVVVVGTHVGKIRAMFDDHQKPIKEAPPSIAVEILGLSGVPEAGDPFYVVENERLAREIALKRQEQAKLKKLQEPARITLEDIYAQIQEGKIKELNCIVKADVQGSLEAVVDSLKKILQQETDHKLGLNFIHTGVGDINASDVILADASNAIIIGFQVEVDTRAKEELEQHPVDVRTYRIIYDAVNDVKKALEGLLEPKTRKKFVARVEIRQVFKLSKAGVVAGCFVQKGKIHRKVQVDILRNGQVVFSGALSSLKRFKDDVREVAEGFECGLTLAGFDQIESGDVLEAYELEKILRTL